MITNNIKNYLRNNTYNINISQNTLYINNYKKIDNISENNINIIFNDFTLKIKGNDFKVLKMIEDEVLFNGNIESIEFTYK